MKKMIISVMLAASIVSIGGFRSDLAEAANISEPKSKGNVCGYVDENGDGICDWAEDGCEYVDKNGDGICDWAENGCEYVDENADGICDRCQEIRVERGSDGDRRYRRMCRWNYGNGTAARCQRNRGQGERQTR